MNSSSLALRIFCSARFSCRTDISLFFLLIWCSFLYSLVHYTCFFFFFLMIRRPPISPLFPYTPLFRSDSRRRPTIGVRRPSPEGIPEGRRGLEPPQGADPARSGSGRGLDQALRLPVPRRDRQGLDRKSTRLNSSHT